MDSSVSGVTRKWSGLAGKLRMKVERAAKKGSGDNGFLLRHCIFNKELLN